MIMDEVFKIAVSVGLAVAAMLLFAYLTGSTEGMLKCCVAFLMYKAAKQSLKDL